jgi:histidine ammonia-lyase
LANPRSVDSTPTSANQEDHVSMACHAARRLGEMTQNLAGIVAVEAMAATQGIELRAPLQTSLRLKRAIGEIRAACPPLGDDRIISNDIDALKTMILETEKLTGGDDVTKLSLEPSA